MVRVKINIHNVPVLHAFSPTKKQIIGPNVYRLATARTSIHLPSPISRHCYFAHDLTSFGTYTLVCHISMIPIFKAPVQRYPLQLRNLRSLIPLHIPSRNHLPTVRLSLHGIQFRHVDKKRFPVLSYELVRGFDTFVLAWMTPWECCVTTPTFQ